MDIESRWHDLIIRADSFDLEGRQSCGILVPVNCGNGVCCPPASTCVAAGSGSNCLGPIGGITVPGLTLSAPAPAATSTAAPLPPTTAAPPPPAETPTTTVVLPPPTTLTTLTVIPTPSSSTSPPVISTTTSQSTPPVIPLPTSSTVPTSPVSSASVAIPSFQSTFSTTLVLPSSSAGSTNVGGGAEGSPTTSTGSTGAAVSITPITNGATNGTPRKGNELSTAEFVGIAIGAGTALVLLIILAASAVIVWRRRSSRRSWPRDSDVEPITREISPPRRSFHALSDHDDAESEIRAKDEPWAMSGAQAMTEEPAEVTRGVSWFQLPMPALARSSTSSTFSRPGPATSLHSHPLARRSSAPSLPQTNNRDSGGVPRVVRKSSSRSPPRAVSPPSGPIDRQARVSDTGSLGSLSSEAERHLTVNHGGSMGLEGDGSVYISRPGSGSSNGEEQRQPMNLLPVFQKPVYVQLPGRSGAIVELI